MKCRLSTRKAVIGCAVALALAAAAPDLAGLGFVQRSGHSVPLDTRLVDDDGHAASLGAMIGHRPTVLALGYYTCPTLCGVVRETLFRALPATGLDPAAMSVVYLSIDPAERAADAARARLRDAPADRPTWHFATAAAPAVRAIADAVGYHFRPDPVARQFIHPAGIVLLTGDGVVSSYLLGAGYESGELRAAIVRARAGGFEQFAQPVLLLCFHFDAATGRYDLAIGLVLRLAGAVTIAGILLLLALLHWKQRKNVLP